MADQDAQVGSITLPAPLRWASRALWGQAVAVTVLGVIATVAAVRESSAAGATEAVALLACAALLAWLGWALWRRRAWARGATVVLQLMLFPIGYYLILAGRWWIGVPLWLIAILVIGLVVNPASTRALGLDRSSQ